MANLSVGPQTGTKSATPSIRSSTSARSFASSLKARSFTSIKSFGSSVSSKISKTASSVGQSIESGAINALGVAEPLKELKKDLEDFRQRVEQQTASILVQGQDPKADDGVKKKVADVQNIVNEITKFLKEQEERKLYERASDPDDVRKEIRAFQLRLTSAVEAYRTDILMRVESGFMKTMQQQADRAIPVPAAPVIPQFPKSVKPSYCYGRDAILEPIIKTLTGPASSHVAILGPGGIGKTHVALTVLHDPQIEKHFGPNRIFLDCEGSTSVDGLLNVLAAALKISKGGDPRRAVTECLGSLDGPVLLLLDNWESVWDTRFEEDVEQLLDEFGSIDNLSFILTIGRTILPTGTKWTRGSTFELSPLTPEESRRLFTQISGKGQTSEVSDTPIDTADIDRLLEQMDGLPRAITLIATQGQFSTPSELLSSYETEGTRMLTRGRGDRQSNFDKTVELAINCMTMRQDPNAVEVLRFIALLPDGVNRDELEAIFPSMTVGMNTAVKSGRTLLHVALVHDSGGRLKVSQPIRVFMKARKPADQGGNHWQEAQSYFAMMASSAEHIGRTIGADPVKNLTKEARNVQAVLLYSLCTSLPLVPILEAISEFAKFVYLTHSEDCTPLLKAALVKAGEAPELSRNRAALLLALGRLQTQKGQYDDAETAIREAQDLFQDASNAPRVIDCLLALADVFCKQEQWDDATIQVRAAEHKLTLDDEDDQIGKAVCAQKAGDILREEGKLDDAKSTLEKALEMYEAAEYALGVAECSRDLALILTAQGQSEEAEKLLRKAKDLFDEIGFTKSVEACNQMLVPA